MSDAEVSGRGGRLAIDLGCGAGRDTRELLRRRWRVLAVDNQPDAIRFLRSIVPAKHRTRLRTRVASFESVKLPRCDLINASYSLPFCRPERFNRFWHGIIGSLRSGGWFVGHFFGVRDEWVGISDMTFHNSLQVKALLRTFEVEFFEEKEWDGKTASGKRKHWHVISVVARKL
jgi:SAM-dependent methyltransferase